MIDPAEVCPICREPITGYESQTEVLEEYADGTVDKPNHPRRVPLRARRNVPGPTVETFQPCGHQRRS